MKRILELRETSRRWVNWLLGFGLWTVYAIFSASLTHYRMAFSQKPLTWAQAFYIEGSYAYAAAALSPLVILLAKRFPLRAPYLWRSLTVHVGGTFLFSLLASFFWDFLTGRGPFFGGHYTPGRFFSSLDWGLDFGVLLYWIIVLLHYALHYYRRYEAGLVSAADLNAQLAHAQLQALKMQLHPHFLFNTLHAISELVYEDPPAAERMIVGLSQLLRLSLETSEIEVPLNQEMRFVELYLDIERTRFETRLEVELQIEERLKDALVPHLILQPLIENSIKHGIAHRSAGGRIVLKAAQDGEALVLSVSDNGSGRAAEENGSGQYREGIGLGTTRARLEKLYGANQSLYLARHRAGNEVVLRLPLKLRSMEVLQLQ